MKIKYVTLLIALVITLVGCTTIEHNLVDPTGRKIPDPSYILAVLDTDILIVFYYASYDETVDLDGSSIPNPDYLDFLKFHDFSRKKTKAVTLTIEVRNPQGLEYSMYQEMELVIRKDSVNTMKMQVGGEMYKSNLPYRQFVFKLPLREDVRTVDNLVKLYVGKHEVARIGNFRYNLQ